MAPIVKKSLAVAAAIGLGLAVDIMISIAGYLFGMYGALVIVAIGSVLAYWLGNFKAQVSVWLLCILVAIFPFLSAVKGFESQDVGTPAWSLATVVLFLSVYFGSRVKGVESAT